MDLIAIQYMIAIFSAISGFFLALKPVRAAIAKLWAKTFGRKAARQAAFEIEIRTTLAEVLSEMRPNGGASMRDAIDRIDYKQGGFDAFLNAQLNIQNVAVVRTDAKGKLTNVNRQYQRMMGYSLAEVLGEGWINVIHPDNRDKIVDNWKDAVEAEREFSEDIKYLRVDGTSFMAHANVYREIDDNGNIRGWLGVIIPLDADEPHCPHLDKCKVND